MLVIRLPDVPHGKFKWTRNLLWNMRLYYLDYKTAIYWTSSIDVTPSNHRLFKVIPSIRRSPKPPPTPIHQIYKTKFWKNFLTMFHLDRWPSFRHPEYLVNSNYCAPHCTIFSNSRMIFHALSANTIHSTARPWGKLSPLLWWRADRYFWLTVRSQRPPLWSSGHSFWLQIQRSRVRFPALPDFSE